VKPFRAAVICGATRTGVIDVGIGKRFRGKTIQVACATNRDWLPHCATMLQSLMAHQRRPVHVHYLPAEDVTPSLLERLSRMIVRAGAELSVHRVPSDRLSGLDTYAPPAVWHRIFLPELLPELDRVLYLDADLIVTDSLLPLWRIDLSDHYVGAVTNVFPSPEWGDRHCAALGLERRELYFNSGVLLMNLRQLRRDGCVQKIQDYALSHADHWWSWEVSDGGLRGRVKYVLEHPGRGHFADQDALNRVLARRRLSLHPRWNCMNQIVRPPWSTWSREIFGPEAVAEAGRNPAILHFSGSAEQKPWHPRADQPGAGLYWRHRKQTPWSENRGSLAAEPGAPSAVPADDPGR
jgi:lipopolysaccharide biosynthesis glycosyltransferase